MKLEKRPLKNRATDELKAILKTMELFEYVSNEAQKVRINQIRYELNVRLNPVVRAFRAVFGNEVRP